VWTLAFPPVFAAVSFGQNATLSLVLLAATYVLLARGRDASAGAVLGLLLYKPQLVAVVAAALLLDRRWRAVGGCALAAAVLGAATLSLSPAAALAYVHLGPTLVTMTARHGFPTWNMHSLPAFLLLLLPSHPQAARLLGAAASLAVLAWMRRTQPAWTGESLRRWYAVAIVATVLASPHLFVYDLSLLVLPALLSWPDNDDDAWAGAAALVWVATVFSGPLARGMQAAFGPALQPSVAAIAFAALALFAPAPD